MYCLLCWFSIVVKLQCFESPSENCACLNLSNNNFGLSTGPKRKEFLVVVEFLFILEIP